MGLPLAAAAAAPTISPQIGASAIGATGGVAGSILGGIQARKNLKRQHKYNRELADHVFSQNLEMWDRTNRYNTPAAQMQRLKEGGLNPHLVWSKGTPMNTSSPAPRYAQPTVDYSKIPPPVNPGEVMKMFNDFRKGVAQGDLLREQVSTQREQTLLKAKENWKAEMQNFITENEKYGYWKRSPVVRYQDEIAPGVIRITKYGKHSMYDKAYMAEARTAEQRADQAKLKSDLMQMENRFQDVVTRMAEDGISMQDKSDIRQMWDEYGKVGAQTYSLFKFITSTFGDIISWTK